MDRLVAAESQFCAVEETSHRRKTVLNSVKGRRRLPNIAHMCITSYGLDMDVVYCKDCGTKRGNTLECPNCKSPTDWVSYDKLDEDTRIRAEKLQEARELGKLRSI